MMVLHSKHFFPICFIYQFIMKIDHFSVALILTVYRPSYFSALHILVPVSISLHMKPTSANTTHSP